MISEPTLGALCALGAAMTWAVTSLLVRSLSPPLGSVAVNALRSTLGGGLLLAWVASMGGLAALVEVSWSTLALLALSIVAAIAVGDSVFFESARWLGLGRAMTISMTYPVGAAGLGALFLDEPITRAVAAGTLITLAGLVLIVSPWAERAAGERFWLGVGAATLASVAWAISVALVRAPLRDLEPATAQAVRLPLAALVLWATPWARGSGAALARLGGPALGRLALLSVLTVFSSVMFAAGIKYAGVAVAAVLSSTAPMFAIPLGLIFLGERLSPTALAGAAITVAGIVVLQL